MSEEKHRQIISALEEKARDVKYGELTVEFKIHDGRISSGEIIGRKEKLG